MEPRFLMSSSVPACAVAIRPARANATKVRRFMGPRRRGRSAIIPGCRSACFLDPRRLDRLEDLLPGAAGIVVEALERENEIAQVDEVDALRIQLRVPVGERDGDVARVDPLHFFSPGWIPAF